MMTTTVAPTTTPIPETTEPPTTEPPTTIVDPGEGDTDLDGDADLDGGDAADEITRDNLISSATGFAQDEESIRKILDEINKGTPIDEAMNSILQEIALSGGGIGVEFQGPTPDYILVSIPGLPEIVETGINKISLKNPDGTWKTPTQIRTDVGEVIGTTIGKIGEIPGQVIGKVQDVLNSGSPEDVFATIEDILVGGGVGVGGTVVDTPPWLSPELLDDLKGIIGDIFSKWQGGDDDWTDVFGGEFPTIQDTVDDSADDGIDDADDSLADDSVGDEIKTDDTVVDDDDGRVIPPDDNTTTTTTIIPDEDLDEEPPVVDDNTSPTTTLTALPPIVDDPPPVIIEDDPTTTPTPEVTPEPTPADPEVTPDPTEPPEDVSGGGGGGMFSDTGTGYMAGIPYQPPGFVSVLYQQARNPAMNALDRVIQDSLFKGMI